MTAQNVNKSISQKLDRAIEFIRPDHNPRQKDNMQKPIDDVPPNPNTADPNADNINKNDKQKQEFSLTFTVTTDTDGNVEKSTHHLIYRRFLYRQNKQHYLRFGGQRTNPFVKRFTGHTKLYR